MSDHKFISYEENDQIASLLLQREDVNLLNIEMIEEVCAVLQSLSDGRNLKAFVIKAAGKVFCAGLDYSGHGPESIDKLLHAYHRMFRLLQRLECPTVACVPGAALGAGCELACFCDLVLSSENARFGLPEIKTGLFSPLAAADFSHYAHLKHLYEMLLVGDAITADEARIMGLVNKVYAASEFETRCQEFIYRLTANPGATLRLVKKAVRAGLERKFPESLAETEGIFLRELMLTEQAKEGMAAISTRLTKYDIEP
jgi:cyclohexa-1,5-dienecarbonyl-CoA hydratase